MIKIPRFLQLSDRVMLISVTLERGNITHVDLPYQCVGLPGQTVEGLMQGLTEVMYQALHTGPILQVTDLPEDVQKAISDALASEPSSPEPEAGTA